MGSSSPTAVRAFLTRRREPSTVASYAVLIALITVVVVGGAVLVATQFNSL